MDVNWLDLREGRWLFRDRVDAGIQLAERLAPYGGEDVIVLAIPRGGAPVGAEVARRLGAEFDVVVARKLGAPFSPELAIGAVTADGGRFLNEEIMAEVGVSDTYLASVTAAERAEVRRREQRFRGSRPAPRIQGRTVIVVDDGLATGATMRAALRSLREKHPAELIVAVPVGPVDTCVALRAEADAVVCLYQPDPFYAVGLYYRLFAQTEDAEVQRLLQEAYARPPRSLRQAS